jgi:penicillin V acylase-like amidase (Ntn superfamily)
MQTIREYIKEIGDKEFKKQLTDLGKQQIKYPNWIITDTRFPNELKTVKDKGGITIRVNRSPVGSNEWITYCKFLTDNPNKKGLVEMATIENFYKWSKEHESETSLDSAIFDYVIDNNGTIEELIEKVRIILVQEKII